MEIEVKVGIAMALLFAILAFAGYYAQTTREAAEAEEQCLLQYNTADWKRPNKIIFCFDEKTAKYVPLEKK